MSEQDVEPSEDEVVEALFTYAAQQMDAGVVPQQVESLLVEKGLDAESASIVGEKLTNARSDEYRRKGTRNLVAGAVWCIGGTLVTVLSMNAGGTRYIIAWGAIVFGAIQFVAGLVQMGRAS